jgi:hypothetical protein
MAELYNKWDKGAGRHRWENPWGERLHKWQEEVAAEREIARLENEDLIEGRIIFYSPNANRAIIFKSPGERIGDFLVITESETILKLITEGHINAFPFNSTEIAPSEVLALQPTAVSTYGQEIEERNTNRSSLNTTIRNQLLNPENLIVQYNQNYSVLNQIARLGNVFKDPSTNQSAHVGGIILSGKNGSITFAKQPITGKSYFKPCQGIGGLPGPLPDGVEIFGVFRSDFCPVAVADGTSTTFRDFYSQEIVAISGAPGLFQNGFSIIISVRQIPDENPTSLKIYHNTDLTQFRWQIPANIIEFFSFDINDGKRVDEGFIKIP